MDIVVALALTSLSMPELPAGQILPVPTTPTAGYAYVAEGQFEAFRGIAPAVSVMSQQEMTGSHWAISFHRIWLPGERGEQVPVWIARRRSAKGQEVATTYADGRRCHVISSVLQIAEQLERPAIFIVGVPFTAREPADTREEIYGGPVYRFHANAVFRTDNIMAEISVVGGGFSPVAAWAVMAEATLADCWEATPPGGEE